ncbi:MAG: hypothetical protein ABSF93_01960 [Candidatus Sulfotelmatobacter sp.]
MKARTSSALRFVTYRIRVVPSFSRSKFYITHLLDPAAHLRHLIE